MNVATFDWSTYAAGTQLSEISGWALPDDNPLLRNGFRISDDGTSLRAGVGGNQSFAVHNAASPSHSISVVTNYDSSSIGNRAFGPTVRWKDDKNSLYTECFNGNQFRIIKRLAGVTSVLATYSVTVSSSDTLKLEHDNANDTVEFFINDVSQGVPVDVSDMPKANYCGLTINGALSVAFGNVSIETLVDDIITVNESLYRQVFPVYGGTRQHAISGAYSSSVSPSSIEYRIESLASGATVVDWQALDAAPSNGLFSGTVTMPKGNYYRIAVRFSNNVSIVHYTYAIGFGILMEFGGQSNTSLLFGNSGSADAPSDEIAVYDGDGFYKNSSLHINTALNSISAQNQCCVAGFNTSVAATAIDAFLPNGANYSKRVDLLNDVGGQINLFWWGQGEANTSNPVNYKTLLGELYTDILTRTGLTSQQLPILIVQLGREVGGGGDSGWNGIRDAQSEFVRDTSGAYISHQTVDLPMQDSLHRDASGKAQEMLRFAESSAFYLSGGQTTGRGPTVTRVDSNGNNLIVILDLNGSTAINIPTGAEVNYYISNDDFSTEQSPNSVTATGNANEFQLNFTSLPSGTIKIRSHRGADFDTSLFITGDKQYDSQNVMVEPMYLPITVDSGAGNTPPSVSIDTVTNMGAGATQELSATITDPDVGDTFTYNWSVTAGSLDDPNSATPVFTAPNDGTNSVTVSLFVNDGADNSNTDTAVIGVNVPNTSITFDIGAPDGAFKVYLLDQSDNVVYNGNATFSGGSATISGLSVAAGTTLEGYTIDNESPHVNGAVITGVTV